MLLGSDPVEFESSMVCWPAVVCLSQGRQPCVDATQLGLRCQRSST